MQSDSTKELIPLDELSRRISGFSVNYFLVDVHRDRDSFYALTTEELMTPEGFFCTSGVTLNLIMDGELDKAWDFINSLPDEGHWLFMKMGLTLVHPKITLRGFLGIIDNLKKIGFPLTNVVLTAGRPSILNGFNDFSIFGPFLEKKKDLFIEDLSYIYDKSLCPAIYNLCLSDWYYQQNRLLDSELIVSRTIKQFNRDKENRLLFSALFLEFKIFIAQGKSKNPADYIKFIRKLVKKIGHAEFAYNIDAVEVLCALYSGNIDFVKNWLETDAPNEFTDFNMLDTWRYMIKIRSYIVMKKYALAVSLVERLRPLLEEGKRHMDMCELDLLNAIALFYADKKDIAFMALSRSLKIAKRRGFYRIIEDEGEAAIQVLNAYIKEKGKKGFGEEFFTTIIENARTISVNYPLYLLPVRTETSLTEMEIEILHLLERGKTAEELADYFFISVNTVKFHLKKIYTKLGVKNSLSAVWEGRIRKIL